MDDITRLFQHYFPNLLLLDAAVLFLLIFTRWAVMSMMMPFLGATLLPAPIRVGLASALTLVSFLVLLPTQDFSAHYSWSIYALLFVKEALLGFILGFLTSLIFFAYEIFGEFVDYFRAAGMAKLLVPELKTQASPMGVLMFQVALVIFLALGLHRDVLKNIFESFERFPVLSTTSDFLGADLFLISLEMLGALLQIAVKLSLPILMVSVLLDLGFGLLNRIAPQINAYFLSLPAKMVCGLIILFFVLPFIVDDFKTHHAEFSQFFLRLVK